MGIRTTHSYRSGIKSVPPCAMCPFFRRCLQSVHYPPEISNSPSARSVSMIEVVLSAGSAANSLQLWDLEHAVALKTYRQVPPLKRQCVATLGDHYFLAFSNLKAVEGAPAKIVDSSKIIAYAWDSEAIHSQNFIAANVSAVAGTHDGEYTIAGAEDGSLYVWQTCSGRLLAQFPAIFQHITVLKMDTRNQLLLVGSIDGLIHIVHFPMLLSNPQNPRPAIISGFSHHSLAITDLQWSSSSTRFYSVSQDQNVKIWDVNTRTVLASINFPTTLNAMAVSPAEDIIYVGGTDGNIYKASLWDVNQRDFSIMDDDQSQADVFTGVNVPVRSLAINCDGSVIVGGYDDSTARVWATASCQLLRKFEEKVGAIVHVSILTMPTARVSAAALAKEKKHLPLLQPLSNIVYEKQGLESVPFKQLNPPRLSPNFLSDSFDIDAHVDSLVNEATTKYQIGAPSNPSSDIFAKNSLMAAEIAHLREVNKRWKALAESVLGENLREGPQ